MFMVQVAAARHRHSQPLAVDASHYLFEFAAFIARSIPDAEVHAHLGDQAGDEVVFRGHALVDDGIDLF